MRRKLAAIAALMGIFALTVAPSAANAATRQTLNVLGAVIDAQHPEGSVDPFTDVTIDGGQTWQPAILSRLHPWTTVDGTNAWLNCQSIDPNDTLGQCSDTLPVHALFRYRFWVASDYANTTLEGHFDVDNEANLYLNGLDQAHFLAGPWVGGGDIYVPEMNIQPLMNAGWNYLYVNLEDFGGLSGINYNLTIATDSASPMVLAASGSQVNFDAQGGTVATPQVTVAPGAFLSTVTLPTPTRAGYTFDGWFTAETGGEQVTETYAQGLKPTSDLTLFARWTPIPVEFVTGGTEEVKRTLADTGQQPAWPFAVVGLLLMASSVALVRTKRR